MITTSTHHVYIFTLATPNHNFRAPLPVTPAAEFGGRNLYYYEYYYDIVLFIN